jgi:hypothetical protein
MANTLNGNHNHISCQAHAEKDAIQDAFAADFATDHVHVERAAEKAAEQQQPPHLLNIYVPPVPHLTIKPNLEAVLPIRNGPAAPCPTSTEASEKEL